MTMKQKNTALILAAIMLATSFVASCGSTETPEGDTTTGETTTASAEKERDPIAETMTSAAGQSVCCRTMTR